MKNLLIIFSSIILLTACTKEITQVTLPETKEETLIVSAPNEPPEDENKDDGIKDEPHFPVSNESIEQQKAGKLLKEIYSHSQAFTLIKTQNLGFLPCILLVSIHHESEEEILVDKIKNCLESGEIINQSLYEEYPSRKLLTNLAEEKWSSILAPSFQTLDKSTAKSLLSIIASFSNLKEKGKQNNSDLSKAIERYKQSLEEEAVSVFSSLFNKAFYEKNSKLFRSYLIPLIFDHKKIVLPENRSPYEKPSLYSGDIELDDHETLDKIYKIHREYKNVESENLLKYMSHLNLSKLEQRVYDELNFIPDTGTEILKNAYLNIYKSIRSNQRPNTILWIKKYKDILLEIKNIEEVKILTIHHFKKVMETLIDLHEIRLKLSNTFHRRTKTSLLKIMDEINYYSSFIIDENEIIKNTLSINNKDLINRKNIGEIKNYFTNADLPSGIFSEKRRSLIAKIQEEERICKESSLTSVEDKDRCIDLFLYHANFSSYKDVEYIKDISSILIKDLASLPKREMAFLLVKLMEDALNKKYPYPNTYAWNESIKNMLLSGFIHAMPIKLSQISGLLEDFEKINNILDTILSQENLQRIKEQHQSYLNEIYNIIDEESVKLSKNYVDINIFKKIPKEKALALATHLGAEIKNEKSVKYFLPETEKPYEPVQYYIAPELLAHIIKEEVLYRESKRIAVINKWVSKTIIQHPASNCASVKCQKALLNLKASKLIRESWRRFDKVDLNEEEIYSSINNFIQQLLREKKYEIKQGIKNKIKEKVYKNLKKNHAIFILAQQLAQGMEDSETSMMYQNDISSYLTEQIFNEYEKTDKREAFPWENELYNTLSYLKKEDIMDFQGAIYALKLLHKEDNRD